MSRLHLEEQVMKSELMSKAFATICAMLHTTNANDLECDIQFGDKQYHFDVSAVANLDAASDSNTESRSRAKKEASRTASPQAEQLTQRGE